MVEFFLKKAKDLIKLDAPKKTAPQKAEPAEEPATAPASQKQDAAEPAEKPRRPRRRGGRGRSRKPRTAEGEESAPEAAQAPDRSATEPTPEGGSSDKPPRRRRRGGRGRGPRKPQAEKTDRVEETTEADAEPSPALDDSWDPSSFEVAPEEGKTRFHDLDLPNPILHAIADLDFKYCTPIQAGVLPEANEGKDILGQAQTGTGKTAAFLITLFSRFLANPPAKGRRKGTPRALILAPTRELALQILRDAESLGTYLPFKVLAVYGGEEMEKQRKRLAAGPVDILVATPGRLMDFQKRQAIHLSRVEALVIDEADRMLDMGFIPDVRQIVYSTPNKSKRQTLFFSATLNDDVLRLAGQWTRNPHRVEIEPERIAVDTVDQKVFIVRNEEKFTLLYRLLEKMPDEKFIVFVNRRDEAQRLVDYLKAYRFKPALLSGALAQNVRNRMLRLFKEGDANILVATDVAGRGLHIENVSHVVNFNLPHDPEDYVHRIGRTGRAGASGTSVSFACEEESFYIPAIEEFMGQSLTCLHPEDELLAEIPAPPDPVKRTETRRPRSGGRAGSRGGSRGGPRRPRR